MQLLTIFEKENFKNFINEVNKKPNLKKRIIKIANYFLCNVTNKDKDLNIFSNAYEHIMKNLDNIYFDLLDNHLIEEDNEVLEELDLEVDDDKYYIVYDTCLLSNVIKINFKFKDKKEIDKINNYLNSIVPFMTDAFLYVYKIYNKIPIRKIKVLNQIKNKKFNCFISLNTDKLIKIIEDKTNKKVNFKLTKEFFPIIEKKDILIVPFVKDRLFTEYYIQLALLKYYLYLNGIEELNYTNNDFLDNLANVIFDNIDDIKEMYNSFLKYLSSLIYLYKFMVTEFNFVEEDNMYVYLFYNEVNALIVMFEGICRCARVNYENNNINCDMCFKDANSEEFNVYDIFAMCPIKEYFYQIFEEIKNKDVTIEEIYNILHENFVEKLNLKGEE